jgi:ATP-dependent Clp protease ATP-binding subunit ClpX
MSDDNKKLNCSFCGKSRDQVEKLIAGPSVYICNECVSVSYKIVSQELEDDTDKPQLDSVPVPSEIKAHLDDYIVGHNDVKEMLSVSAYNHYKRIGNQLDCEPEKSNVLLIGPTGSGKTLFAKTLARKMSVPFAIADATTLTEAGYVGEDVESVLERLLVTADFDLESAQKGIVYIDEIDKKSRKSESNTNSRDVSGEGVQQALLRLIEGTTTKVKVANNRKYTEDFVEFDTSSVLFILGGSFVGLEKQIEHRLRRSSAIGFGAQIVTEDQRQSILQKVIAQDIVDYGIIPELIGRLPILGVLDTLTESQLKMIMMSVKNNVLKQSQELLMIDGIDLEFSEEYIDSIAHLAIGTNLGARSLKTLVEQSLINIMYRAPELQESGVVSVIFDKYPVNSNTKPQLIYTDGTQSEDTDYRLYRGTDEE